MLCLVREALCWHPVGLGAQTRSCWETTKEAPSLGRHLQKGYPESRVWRATSSRPWRAKPEKPSLESHAQGTEPGEPAEVGRGN